MGASVAQRPESIERRREIAEPGLELFHSHGQPSVNRLATRPVEPGFSRQISKIREYASHQFELIVAPHI
jgi:hypothetical protein